MYGWAGKILKIDLTTGDITTEPTEAYADQYLGGRGLGVRLIYDNYKPGTDALIRPTH
jgi:aldehyde:ferredoxin oxidoreductase